MGSEDKKRGGKEPDSKADVMEEEQVVTSSKGYQAHALAQSLGGPRGPEAENRVLLLDYQSLLRLAPSQVRLWMKLKPLQ